MLLYTPMKAPALGRPLPQPALTLGPMPEARRQKSSPLAQQFGERLRQLREQRFLSQRDLAKAVGIEVAQISRYERGLYMPSAETLVDLARVLRVGVGRLLVGEDEGSPITDEPIRDISLLERFRDLEKLSRKDREIVIALIDAVIASRQYDEVATRRRVVRRGS